MSNKTRYGIIMLLGVLLNQIFFTLSALLNLPFWLDLPGTALAAIVLEPTAGLLVGFVNNFYEAIFYKDANGIIYYAVSASVALIVGINMRKEGRIVWKRALMTIPLVIIVTSVLSTVLLYWDSGGVLISHWEIVYHDFFLGIGLPNYISTFLGIFVIKVYDTLASGVIIAVTYFILPAKLKYSQEELELLK